MFTVHSFAIADPSDPSVCCHACEVHGVAMMPFNSRHYCEFMPSVLAGFTASKQWHPNNGKDKAALHVALYTEYCTSITSASSISRLMYCCEFAPLQGMFIAPGPLMSSPTTLGFQPAPVLYPTPHPSFSLSSPVPASIYPGKHAPCTVYSPVEMQVECIFSSRV